MSSVVPLHVTVRRGPNEKGELVNRYPPFDTLPPDVREGLRFTALIDKYGGWMYDQCSHMGEVDDTVKDRECTIGVILVPKTFADLAVNQWPETCTILTPTQFEDWYDKRIGIVHPDELVSSSIVDSIRAKHGIKGTIDPNILTAPDEKAAVDPLHPMPGIRTNHNKTAARRMKRLGLAYANRDSQ